jgi:type I restriction enzyme M protein
MLDTTTKKRIDDCRDILVGKLPDPKAQIEQITIALIYKFMDDMDKEAIELGAKAKFFSGNYAKYSWANLFDTKVTATEMLTLYSDAIAAMDKNPNIPQLFRDIFKNAFLPYRDPETLKLFLKTIGEFKYTHSEKLGDAFEYLLSVMGSQGDAGQFRTPRHIIDFLVAVVDPKKTDTILDPACGTAGFLISAFKHILGGGDGVDGNGNGNGRDAMHRVSTITATKTSENHITITPDEQKRIISNFAGYDISPDMVRLSLVNLYLHGFSDPHIWEYDTLSSEDRWNETADVILANPPFMSPKGGIRPHKKFSISSNRSEVLFVDYIAEHLNPKGRAGIIVPEGVIFQSGTAYKDLRKMLVDNYLYALVSLPAGVFNPYSGVKTSILLLDKELAKINEEILFVKIDNDGFGLGAQRNAVKGGQLDEAIQVIRLFVETQCIASLQTTIAHTVPKAEIAKNGDYNLSGERYKNQQNIGNHQFETIEIGEIMDFQYGKPLKQENRIEGDYPVYGSNGIVGWHNEYIANPPFIVVGRKGSAGALHYSLKPGYPIDTTFFIENKKPEEINLKYAYYILGTLNLDKVNTQAGIPGLNRNDAYKLQIPLPPLSVQEEIVAEIEGYQKIIDGAKMVVENYKPKIDIDAEWELMELSKIIKLSSGKGLTSQNMVEGLYPVYGGNGINGYHNEYFLEKPTIVIGRFGAYCGVVHITESNSWITDNGLYVTDFLQEIELAFLAQLLTQLNLNRYAKVGGQPSISQKTVTELSIPLPTLEVQRQIVSRIEKEQELVNANKQLIELFEQKIKARIAKVWGTSTKLSASEEKTVKHNKEDLSMAAEPGAEYLKH